MDVVDMQIRGVSGEIKGLVEENGDAKLLTTSSEVGYYNALLLVVEIGDVDMCLDSEKFCAYAGLVSSVSGSGKKTVYRARCRQNGLRV